MATTTDLQRLFYINALGLTEEEGARLSTSDLELMYAQAPSGFDLTSLGNTISALEARVDVLEGANPPAAPPLSVDDMVNSWWVEPNALAVGDDVYVGGVGSAGNVGIAAFDTTNSTAQRITLGTLAADDHNVSAFLVENDKSPITAYAGHAQEQLLRLRIGAGVGDVSSLSAATEIQVPTTGLASYVHLIRKPGTDTIAMSTRHGAGWVTYHSTDWGQTWTTTPSNLVQRQYITFRISGNTAMFSVADHPTSGGNVSLSRFDVDLTTGAVTTPKGTALSGNFWDTARTASPLFPFANGFVYRHVATDPADHSVDFNTSRLLDIGPSGSIAACRMLQSNPQVGGMYGIYRAATNETASPPSMFHPDSTERGWTFEPIVASGVPVGFAASGYVGGMAFGESDDIVYLVREDSGTWTLERWENSGGTWALTNTIDTRSDGTKLGRPQIPWGRTDVLAAVHYQHYDVSSYTDYSGQQKLYDLTIL